MFVPVLAEYKYIYIYIYSHEFAGGCLFVHASGAAVGERLELWPAAQLVKPKPNNAPKSIKKRIKTTMLSGK